MIEFERSSIKEKANLKLHGVSFEDTQSVFYDDYAVQFYNEVHSEEEDRFLLRMSNRSKLLMIVHFERDNGNIVRLISARKATPKESSHDEGPNNENA